MAGRRTGVLGVCAQVAADKAEIYDTVVFSTPPRVTEQQLWPKHCVQETWGAELHPQLKVRVGVADTCRVWLLHLLAVAVMCFYFRLVP